MPPALMMNLFLPDAWSLFHADPEKALPAYQALYRKVLQGLAYDLGVPAGVGSLAALDGFRPLRGNAPRRMTREQVRRHTAIRD